MSSSIFSSKSEALVIMGVVLLLLVCESLLRTMEVRLSLDVRHIREIPAIVERLRTAQGRRVLFLGNSLTRDGVDRDTIRQIVGAPAGEGLTLESIYPDDTALCDWYYVYRTFLANRQVAPDLVVVGFVTSQLADHAPVHPNRLAGYPGGWATLPEAFRDDILDAGDRIQYLLASLSRLLVNQERLRTRLLDVFVPHYRDAAQVLNRATRSLAHKPQERAQPSYQRLRTFLQLVQTHGTKVVLVAMPVGYVYEIPEALAATVAAEGVLLLDLRHVAGLAEGDFPDGYHLSSAGAKIYSAALATSLRQFGLL